MASVFSFQVLFASCRRFWPQRVLSRLQTYALVLALGFPGGPWCCLGTSCGPAGWCLGAPEWPRAPFCHAGAMLHRLDHLAAHQAMCDQSWCLWRWSEEANVASSHPFPSGASASGSQHGISRFSSAVASHEVLGESRFESCRWLLAWVWAVGR